MSSISAGDRAPVCSRRTELTSADGMLAMIPAKMISEMPLPMPRSVICSPSHMMKAVPAVRVIMVSRMKPIPGLGTTSSPAGPRMVCRPTAIPAPWMTDRMMVP